MKTLSSTAVKNRIAEALKLAQEEPVAIQSHGATVAFLISPTEYERLSQKPRPLRKGGYMKGLFEGVDWDEVLSRPARGFDEYM